MGKTRARNAVAGVAAAALLLAPATAASAATPAENCFIHTDDWVRCVCVPVAKLLTTITGDDWQCA